MVEITEIPPLTPGEMSLVDHHSFVNVLSVLRGELAVLGLTLAGDPSRLRGSIGICDEIIASLNDQERALASARRVDRYAAAIFRELGERLERENGAARLAEVKKSVANIESVFAIFRVRARELLARAAAPDPWFEAMPEDLLENFTEFCDALVKNSKGRYGIVFNAARQQTSDYYVDLKIESATDRRLHLPRVFQDVMRDLVANARKYTEPGGKIIGAMFQDAEYLQFVVADTGRGIPGDEVGSVVRFGKRASNVSDVKTNGGGFGLTKAFLVTKQFHGRFWIDSKVDVGTEIRIKIPCSPEARRASATRSSGTGR